MSDSLLSIFRNHKGRVSDKWLSYIYEWENIFTLFREQNINIFEIGVHNGGSLEIWSEYFINAKNIIGCDNNVDCKKIMFSDPRISLIIGDVNSDSVEEKIREFSTNLKIIIDDGSHHSGDIIHSFSKYFKYLKPGGYYIIEDLHTSYWDSFDGGFNNPYSALAFLKKMADIINFEHWRNNKSRKSFLSPYESRYNLNFEEFDLCTIHSVTFLNSMCLIKRNTPEENKLGKRMVVGLIEEISDGSKKLNSTSIHDLTFEIKDDSCLDQFYLIDQNDILNEKLEGKEALIKQLTNKVTDQMQANKLLGIKIEEKSDIIELYEQNLNQIQSELIKCKSQITSTKAILKAKDTLIQKQNRQIQKLTDESIGTNQYATSLKEKITKYESLLDQKDTDLEDRAHFICHLKKSLENGEEEILSYALDASWQMTRPLRKIHNLIKRGWPPRISIRKILQNRASLKEVYEYFLIKQSDLFDFEYYLKAYPDIRRANINPLMHFIKYGWQERRNPSNTFPTEKYLSLFPEIEEAGVNPLIHYLKNNVQNKPSLSFYDKENYHFHYLDLATPEAHLTSTNHNISNPPHLPDIIILPIIDWDFRFQRPQQLACQLAGKGHRIFYVNTKIRNNESNAPFIKPIMQNIFSVQIASSDRFANVHALLEDETVEDLKNSVRKLRDHFLINSAVVMVDSPVWRKLAIRLKANFGWKLIYDCMDLHTGFSGNSISISLNEQKLLKYSDLVFVSSHYLYDHVEPKEDQTFLIQNGTDFDFFHQAASNIPNKEIQDLSKPIIGYYGAIADWFDTELIGKLAAGHPEWTFLLIGSTYLANLNPLRGLSNVHLLGEKPYSELPSYLSHFDVCLIPFKDVPLTQATNPVKLYEYLSAGKPVVATKLDELSYFSDYVTLAQTKEEWETAIQESLHEKKTTKLFNIRYSFAKENSWVNRAKHVQNKMLGLYPKVSIIIISFNNLEFTKLCLDSIEKNTSYPNYEIIIVDNASDKKTKSFLTDLQSKNYRIQVYFNQTNLGFAKANNQAFDKSSGEYLVFLNNDTIVTPGWIHRLLLHLQSTPNAGIVGPVTNSIGNEAKIAVPYQNLSEINHFAAQRDKDYSGKSFEINVLALYCAMISRELFEALNGLDERYEIGMFEDDDLAMKIKQIGMKLICAEDVFVHHFHSVSFKNLGDKKFSAIFNANRKRFEEKWGVEWVAHTSR